MYTDSKKSKLITVTHDFETITMEKAKRKDHGHIWMITLGKGLLLDIELDLVVVVASHTDCPPLPIHKLGPHQLHVRHILSRNELNLKIDQSPKYRFLEIGRSFIYKRDPSSPHPSPTTVHYIHISTSIPILTGLNSSQYLNFVQQTKPFCMKPCTPTPLYKVSQNIFKI